MLARAAVVALLAVGACVPAARVAAQPAPEVIDLWPEGVPGRKPGGGVERVEDGRVYNVQRPTLTVVRPAPGMANGTAVVVCPGGGYVRLAIGNEGSGAAGHFAALGVTAFVLKYRLVEYGFPAPLQDVLRAIRVVRSRAAEFGLDAGRIGVFGASAGGHVAAMAGTLYDAPEGRTGHTLDDVSARPDFLALLYPVVLMDGEAVHAGSRRALLGEHPSREIATRLSLDSQVTSRTPPTFIVHTAEDASVPLENSLALFRALRRERVPVELHAYERGPHGFGFRTDLGPTSGWFDRLADFMRAHGWLGAAAGVSRPHVEATPGLVRR